jgi:hypothetical protein
MFIGYRCDLQSNHDHAIPRINMEPRALKRLQMFFEKNSENMYFPPENGWIEKVMVPSESAPQELSNGWSMSVDFENL